jgi:hypothetical protein
MLRCWHQGVFIQRPVLRDVVMAGVECVCSVVRGCGVGSVQLAERET